MASAARDILQPGAASVVFPAEIRGTNRDANDTAPNDGFTSGGYDPTLKLIVDRDLPQGFSLSGNVVVSSLTDSDHRFIQHATTLSLAHALHSGWNGYAELYRASALVRDGTSARIADIG